MLYPQRELVTLYQKARSRRSTLGEWLDQFAVAAVTVLAISLFLLPAMPFYAAVLCAVLPAGLILIGIRMGRAWWLERGFRRWSRKQAVALKQQRWALLPRQTFLAELAPELAQRRIRLEREGGTEGPQAGSIHGVPCAVLLEQRYPEERLSAGELIRLYHAALAMGYESAVWVGTCPVSQEAASLAEELPGFRMTLLPTAELGAAAPSAEEEARWLRHKLTLELEARERERRNARLGWASPLRIRRYLFCALVLLGLSFLTPFAAWYRWGAAAFAVGAGLVFFSSRRGSPES